MGFGHFTLIVFSFFIVSLGLFSFSENAFAASVSVPAGSSVPGCEETDLCFVPSTVTIDVGGEVTWSNDDNTAHFVTSNSASGEPDGNFDSGLFKAGTTFSNTFDTAGVYPYHCNVHPWMVGTVVVQTETATTVSTDKTSYNSDDLIKISGTTDEEYAKVQISIRDATGALVAFLGVNSHLDGSYEREVDTSAVFSQSGSYKITAFTSTQSVFEGASVLISVSVEPSPPIGIPIIVSTDRSSYRNGDTIHVSGKVQDLLHGSLVSVQLFEPTDGNLVSSDQIRVGYDRKFSTEITAGGNLFETGGTYTIVVQYGGPSRTAETTFVFKDDIVTTTNIYEVNLNEMSFDVEYTATNLQIIKIDANRDDVNLTLDVKVTDSNANLVLTFQRDSFDARFEVKDDNFFIFGNGNVIDFEEIDNTSEIRTLQFDVKEGTDEIVIFGTHIIGSTFGEPTEEPPTIEEPPPTTQPRTSLFVKTDKSSYYKGEIIKVSGKVTNSRTGVDVGLTVTGPTNEHVSINQPVVDPFGNFEAALETSGALWNKNGHYTIKATYSSQTIYNYTTIILWMSERPPVPQIAFFPPPLKQIVSGTLPENVTCTEGLQIVYKSTTKMPACVKKDTASKLIERGWGVDYFT